MHRLDSSWALFLALTAFLAMPQAPARAQALPTYPVGPVYHYYPPAPPPVAFAPCEPLAPPPYQASFQASYQPYQPPFLAPYQPPYQASYQPPYQLPYQPPYQPSYQAPYQASSPAPTFFSRIEYSPPASPPASTSQSFYPPSTQQQSYSHSPSFPSLTPTTTVRIGAADSSFQPSVVNVPLGTTIRWLNDGLRKHTVTSGERHWDSGDLAPGESYRVTFVRPGTYQYYCRHHQGMQGTIVVGNESAPAVGRFGN